MSDDTSRNVALLIDADNAQPASLDPVLTVLADLGAVNVRRAYGNWSKPGLKTWAALTLKHGIEPQQQFDITKGKNATDMKMTVDAMDLLYRGRVTGFGIMSSDSDFMPLAMRIRQDGLPVYGFGESRTPEAFKRACTRFIDVAALMAEESPAPSPMPARGRARADTQAATPSEAAESSIEQALPPAIGRRQRQEQVTEDPELLKLLIDAYDAVKRDERGYVNLSAMAQLAGNRSSFDARNYGYRRLSDLIEAVPNFQVERREGGRLYVKRLR